MMRPDAEDEACVIVDRHIKSVSPKISVSKNDVCVG